MLTFLFAFISLWLAYADCTDGLAETDRDLRPEAKLHAFNFNAALPAKKAPRDIVFEPSVPFYSAIEAASNPVIVAEAQALQDPAFYDLPAGLRQYLRDRSQRVASGEPYNPKAMKIAVTVGIQELAAFLARGLLQLPVNYPKEAIQPLINSSDLSPPSVNEIRLVFDFHVTTWTTCQNKRSSNEADGCRSFPVWDLAGIVTHQEEYQRVLYEAVRALGNGAKDIVWVGSLPLHSNLVRFDQRPLVLNYDFNVLKLFAFATPLHPSEVEGFSDVESVRRLAHNHDEAANLTFYLQLAKSTLQLVQTFSGGLAHTYQGKVVRYVHEGKFGRPTLIIRTAQGVFHDVDLLSLTNFRVVDYVPNFPEPSQEAVERENFVERLRVLLFYLRHANGPRGLLVLHPNGGAS